MSSKFEGAGHSEAGPNHPHLHQHCPTTQLMCPASGTPSETEIFYILKALESCVGNFEPA